MALQTITIIKIGQTVITNFTSLKVVQKIHDHHTFSLEVRQDLLVDEFQSVMPVSHQLYGEKISIEIKPLDGLNDRMIIADPKNYIMQFYGIVAGVSIKKSSIDNIEESFFIEGYSTSILLENGPESNSFTAMTLRDIVSKVKSGYNIDMQVSPFYNEVLSYTVQYNESCFAFLNRLAMRYGQYFYDNGRVLIFGDSAGFIHPHLIYGVNMQEFRYNIKLMPASFTVIENDNRDGSYNIDDTLNYRKELDGFHQNFINKSNTVYNKKTVIQLNQNAASGHGNHTGAEYTQNKMRAVLSRLMEISASSEVPGVTVGSTVKISGVDKQQESSYRVTEIVHTCDDGGGYENHFKAVNTSDSVFSPKTNPDLIPHSNSQVAIVVANADPDGLSGVKVQMPWQKIKGETTPYIPMIQKYGGEGKGAHWIPEIGDTVFIDFQGNNAELPIVVGTMTSQKEKSGYSTKNNDIKALHTRSNNLLLMNDAQGSVLLQDSAKSFVEFDGKRKIELNTDIFEINVKKLIINASQSTEITTNDYMLNALSQIYVFSKTMQQKISGFMNLFSGTALINSSDKIDIEAKTAKLHGSETALIHSDKKAVINSNGTAKMHGAEGNSLTNTAKLVESSPTETIALAVVYFRPLDSWNGEFGFDWMREKHNGHKGELDYKRTIQGGYKDGIRDLSREEAYKQLKSEYTTITITRKKEVNGQKTSTEYFVPYLALFSQEFIDTMPKDILVTPKCEAELNILVEIEKDLDRLEFEYDDTLLELNNKILSKKTKTEGIELISSTIKIKCLKDLDKDQQICIYAYPKSTSAVAKTKLEAIKHRKLAGKIIVLKNDSNVRKEEKLVLIAVKTYIDAKSKAGEFSPEEKINLYNTLYQSFVVPIIEEATLDLSSHPNFNVGGNNLIGTNIKYSYSRDGKNYLNRYLFLDCKNAFFQFKNVEGDLVNERFKDYFTIYKFGIISNDEKLLGSAEQIGMRNVVMFTLIENQDSTLQHEVLHGLGLPHTHRNDNEIIIKYPNTKYIFPHAQIDYLSATDNVMSYRKIAYTTWHWQWKILNPKIK